MLDFQVRRRFALMRRSFATLGFSGDAAGAARSSDLVFDDSGVTPSLLEQANAVDWRCDEGDAADGVSTPTREAVFRLAYAIRREADTLDELAPRARTAARRLSREEADIAEALGGLDPQDLRPALDLATPPVASLVGEVAATALSVSLAAVRAGASARGFAEASRRVADLAALLDGAWAGIEGLVAAIEERSADTAALAADLRRRGAGLAAGQPETGPRDVAALRRLARETEAVASRIAETAEDLARAVRALSDGLLALVRRQPEGERRATARVSVDLPCEVRVATGVVRGRVRDLSITGALVALEEPVVLAPGQPLSFRLPDVAPLVGSVVEVDDASLRLTFDLRHGANAGAAPALERLVRLADDR
ncbi:PilZ domain-containing protein [Salinarimonas rosea]|uniref:PilZ domain-containing protein n=1 Tax=Salinarimonas rosea TaxID=552063 RepID=UPI0012EB8B2E|nr:PilZ domain-containing protein [Salinarimonas rosea]